MYRDYRKSPLSTDKVVGVTEENHRHDRNLEKELSRLDRERSNKIKQLRQEMQKFCITARSRSASRSPSRSPSRGVSPHPGATQCTVTRPVSGRISISPRSSAATPASPIQYGSKSSSPRNVSPFITQQFRKTPSPARMASVDSDAGSEGGSPQSLSPQSPISPSASPILTHRVLHKRATTSDGKIRKSSKPLITTETIHTLKHDSRGNIQQGPKLSISKSSDYRMVSRSANNRPTRKSSCPTVVPQIIINGDSRSPVAPSKVDNDQTVLATGSSEIVTSQTSQAPSNPKETSTAPESCMGSPRRRDSMSLAPPTIRRYRSRSVPTIPEDCMAYLRDIAENRQSPGSAHSSSSDLSSSHSNIATEQSEGEMPCMRQRSSSVSVPYFSHLKNAPRRDSLLRKYTARRGSYRRTSLTIEKLIADLSKGIHHGELTFDPNSRSKKISDEEWEKLKKCRYLRMPSREGQGPEQKELDVEEIFS